MWVKEGHVVRYIRLVTGLNTDYARMYWDNGSGARAKDFSKQAS